MGFFEDLANSVERAVTRPAFSKKEIAAMNTPEAKLKQQEFGKAYDKAAGPAFYKAQQAMYETYGEQGLQAWNVPKQSLQLGIYNVASTPYRTFVADPLTTLTLAGRKIAENPTTYLGSFDNLSKTLKESYKLATGDRSSVDVWTEGINPVTLGQALDFAYRGDYGDVEERATYFQDRQLSSISGYIDGVASIFLDPVNYVTLGSTVAVGLTAKAAVKGAISRLPKVAAKTGPLESIESTIRGASSAGGIPIDVPRASQTVLAESLREGLEPTTKTTNSLLKANPYGRDSILNNFFSSLPGAANAAKRATRSKRINSKRSTLNKETPVAEETTLAAALRSESNKTTRSLLSLVKETYPNFTDEQAALIADAHRNAVVSYVSRVGDKNYASIGSQEYFAIVNRMKPRFKAWDDLDEMDKLLGPTETEVAVGMQYFSDGTKLWKADEAGRLYKFEPNPSLPNGGFWMFQPAVPNILADNTSIYANPEFIEPPNKTLAESINEQTQLNFGEPVETSEWYHIVKSFKDIDIQSPLFRDIPTNEGYIKGGKHGVVYINGKPIAVAITGRDIYTLEELVYKYDNTDPLGGSDINNININENVDGIIPEDENLTSLTDEEDYGPIGINDYYQLAEELDDELASRYSTRGGYRFDDGLEESLSYQEKYYEPAKYKVWVKRDLEEFKKYSSAITEFEIQVRRPTLDGYATVRTRVPSEYRYLGMKIDTDSGLSLPVLKLKSGEDGVFTIDDTGNVVDLREYVSLQDSYRKAKESIEISNQEAYQTVKYKLVKPTSPQANEVNAFNRIRMQSETVEQIAARRGDNWDDTPAATPKESTDYTFGFILEPVENAGYKLHLVKKTFKSTADTDFFSKDPVKTEIKTWELDSSQVKAIDDYFKNLDRERIGINPFSNFYRNKVLVRVGDLKDDGQTPITFEDAINEYMNINVSEKNLTTLGQEKMFADGYGKLAHRDEIANLERILRQRLKDLSVQKTPEGKAKVENIISEIKSKIKDLQENSWLEILAGDDLTFSQKYKPYTSTYERVLLETHNILDNLSSKFEFKSKTSEYIDGKITGIEEMVYDKDGNYAGSKNIQLIPEQTQWVDEVINTKLPAERPVVVHSGGASGADSLFAMYADLLGFETKAHSFKGHSLSNLKNGKNIKLESKIEHSPEDLAEADEILDLIRNKYVHRPKPNGEFKNNLLRRNYYQVKFSDAVVAVSTITNGIVDGGTSYAVYMGIEKGIPVYVFDQNTNKWFTWNKDSFVPSKMPGKFYAFAGIGTRHLSESGKNAIKEYMRQYKVEGQTPTTNKVSTRPTGKTSAKTPKIGSTEIFVFGSNLAGIHGKGAALTAKNNYGAITGKGVGLQGQSYGIPTKGKNLEKLTPEQIKPYIDKFIDFVKNNPDIQFNLTDIGLGLAGNKPEVIADLFDEVPANIKFITPNSRLKAAIDSKSTIDKESLFPEFKPIEDISKSDQILYTRAEDKDAVQKVIDAGGIYIGRPGQGKKGYYGNPYFVKSSSQADVSSAVSRYSEDLLSVLDGDPIENSKVVKYYKENFRVDVSTEDGRKRLIERIKQIDGKKLVCAGTEPADLCHGNVLLDMLERIKDGDFD